MTLIKYYKADTCYDGNREFLHKKSSRHYPDEYLIGNILEKYRRKRFPQANNIIVVAEPWLGEHQRSGGENTLALNQLVIQHIERVENNVENSLILVPFLYGYHHPGLTIDVKNKTAVYLDPFGSDAHYPEAQALQGVLEQRGFRSLTVTTPQQTDMVSCGPILTASMVKFMEEFMSLGTISVHGFKAPRPNLATERLFQMYVNNTVLEKTEILIDEIMLADPHLWEKVCEEHPLLDEMRSNILRAVGAQKRFLRSLPEDWEKDPVHKRAVQFIKDFQSQITEHIILNDKDMALKINDLVGASQQLFDPLNLNGLPLVEPFKPQDLLSNNHIAQTHAMLGIMDYSKEAKHIPDDSNNSEQDSSNFEQDSSNFERHKNNIQAQFNNSLQTLKYKLDSLDRKQNVAFKLSGTALFDTLNRKQEEFFQDLKPTLTEEEVIAKLTDFRKTCAENVKIADNIMGHGWLYRTSEILTKAIVGLFVGIGMIFGSAVGLGLMKAEHRKQFANTFFTLDKNQQSRALTQFKEKTLGDGEENQGVLSPQNFKK